MSTSSVERGPLDIPEWLVPGPEMPEPIRTLIRKGDFARAEDLLADAAAGAAGRGEETSASLFRNEIERLARIRRDWSLSPLELLAKLQKDIPDATAADLDHWRGLGLLGWIAIDGQMRYFRREPGGLMRVSPDARQRRDAALKARGELIDDAQTTAGKDAAAAKRSKEDLNKHARAALDAAKAAGAPEVLPIEVRVTQRIHVKAGTVPEGAMLRCWMPLPQAYGRQSGPLDLQTTPALHRVSAPGAPMATVFMQQPAAIVGDPTIFEASYTYRTSALAPTLDWDRMTSAPPDRSKPEIAAALMARPPHVPSDAQRFTDFAWKLAGHDAPPLLRAYRIWEWIDRDVLWVPEIEYSTMCRIAEKALDMKRGDCGVQSLLFITLCRAVDVPARWQSGWVVRPDAWNMHDWTEIHVEPYGWIPVDPSFGKRKTDDRGVANYFFGHIDAFRMIANLDFGQQFDPPKTHWRSDPVDNQRGEVEWDGGNIYYDDWTYTVTAKPINR